jgi:hypothetical protein
MSRCRTVSTESSGLIATFLLRFPGGMGHSPETPAGAMGVAHAAGGRAQRLACLSRALPGLSSPSSLSLCTRLLVRVVVYLLLYDRHVQQARV